MRSCKEGQLEMTETRPPAPNPQEAKESFVRRGGQWREKAWRPSSDVDAPLQFL